MFLQKKKAFTLAEMMVVLLIISLAVAAFMPIMTKRSKSTASSSSGNNIWQYVSDTDKSIYTNEGNTLGAIIGTDSFGAGENSKLLINTSGLGQSDILMKEVGTKTGLLTVDSKGNVGLGNISLDANPPTKNGQVSIGNNAQTGDNNQVSIGTSAIAAASSDSAITIGNGSQAIGSSSIAIGQGAGVKTSTSNSLFQGIAIGSSATADGWQCVAIGPYAHATSSVTSDPAMAIGESAVASDRNTVALGSQAKALNSFSVAIGVDATTTGAHQIVLGTKDETVIIPGRLQVGVISEVPRGGNYLSNVQFTQASLGSYYTLNAYGASTSYDNKPNSIISDRRLKNIKGSNNDGLEQIRQLKTYNYTLKKDKNKTPRVGVMAQDLKKVFPHAVTKGSDGYFMIRQEDMFYAMLNSIQQLDTMFHGLVEEFKFVLINVQATDHKVMSLTKKDRINSIKIAELEAKNKQFEARLKKLEKK